MKNLDLKSFRKNLNTLTVRREAYILLRNKYLHYYNLALKRNKSFTYSYQSLAQKYIGFESNLSHLSYFQNKLMLERIYLTKHLNTSIFTLKPIVINTNKWLNNWRKWTQLETQFSRETWWAHDHNRLLDETRLKMFKSQEIIDKITRDIIYCEDQIQDLLDELFIEREYTNNLKNLQSQKNLSKNFLHTLHITWKMRRYKQTFWELKHEHLFLQHQNLESIQKILHEKIYKAAYAELQFSIQDEKKVYWWYYISKFFQKRLTKYSVGLNNVNNDPNIFQNVLNNSNFYLKYSKKLIFLKFELNNYFKYFWISRENTQATQNLIKVKRLNLQYYLQLLKENQIKLIHNQLNIMNHQNIYFSQTELNKYEVKLRCKKAFKNKNIFFWKSNKLYFTGNFLKKLNFTSRRLFFVFPYFISFFTLKKSELLFLSNNPFFFQYYNGLKNPNSKKQFFFINFNFSLFSVVLPNLCLLLEIHNSNPNYRRHYWWKWRTPYEFLYNLFFQTCFSTSKILLVKFLRFVLYNEAIPKPYIIKYLIKSFLNFIATESEKIKKLHFSWKTFFFEKSISLKKKIWHFKYYKFNDKFINELKLYNNTYFTKPLGDKLTHPTLTHLSKDFKTYYYYSNNVFLFTNKITYHLHNSLMKNCFNNNNILYNPNNFLYFHKKSIQKFFIKTKVVTNVPSVLKNNYNFFLISFQNISFTLRLNLPTHSNYFVC